MQTISALTIALCIECIGGSVSYSTPPSIRISYDSRTIGTYSRRYDIMIMTTKRNARPLEFIIRDAEGIAFYDVRKNNVPIHQHIYKSGEEPLFVHLSLSAIPNDRITLETADVYDANTSGLVRIMRKSR